MTSLNDVKKVMLTEMVWNFCDPKDPRHLQATRITKHGEAPGFDKITATFNSNRKSDIRFVVELWNANGLHPAVHDEIQETLKHRLGENPNVVDIDEDGRFPAKHVAVINFRKQIDVPNTWRAFDGFTEIIKALWFGEVWRLKKSQRPAPDVVQRTIVDDGEDRLTYGEWMDDQYFAIDQRTTLERLRASLGKLVRLRVVKPHTGGSEEHVGILGVLEHKGWILNGETDPYWPLICVDWVDILTE